MSSPTIPEDVKVLTVGELTRQVRGLLEEAYPCVWVSGEISSFTRASSGHLYITLKDDEAQLKAVMWRGVALRLRFDPHEGLEVIARGRLTVYNARGEYQLAIEELQPKGLGALELALRQLKEKLFQLGYFDPRRKKPLPRFPRRIALVTSPSGAAVRDMLEILGRRWPVADVLVCPVRVQGDGAGQEVAGAVRYLNRMNWPDVIIVGRGGGSTEDLWAFNEECVALALFQSRIPVISAVGHEIDVTIADMVADVRALTPSEAAERVSPNLPELLEALKNTECQLRTLLVQRLERGKTRLEDLAQSRAFRLPLERVREHGRRVDEWSERLRRATEQHLSRAREKLASVTARLESLSPLNVLARGYSLTRTEAGQTVIRDPDQVRPGERIVTDVQFGRVFSRVEACERKEAPASPPRKAP